jgi:L-galactose dehydrogenase
VEGEFLIYRELGCTGLETSVIGFGASPFGDVFGATEPAEIERAVVQAIDLGINFFDVSPYYGLTLAEKRLGHALRGRRQEVLLSTKCGRYGVNDFDFSRARILRSAHDSLERLQTDYVDLLLAHDVEFGNVDQIVGETIPAMRELQKQGLANHIGISGYPLGVLRRIAEEVEVDVILSYCHYNPLNTDIEQELMEFTRTRGIGLINASPMHMGLLNGRAAPSWHPASLPVKAAATRFVDACRTHGSNPAAIALRFCIANPSIATTLVGMATCEEVQQNMQALHITIDPDLSEEIADIMGSVAGMLWPSGRPENDSLRGADA